MISQKQHKDKPLEFYLSLDYPVTFYPEEVGGFTVEIKDLPGCLSQGETVEEAYEMIAEAKELWLEVAHEYGDPIPLPHTMATYSGKTMLRMPTYLHKRLAESAKREGTSLNQYLVSLLSERDSLKGTLGEMKKVQTQLADIQTQLQKSQNSRSDRSPYLVGESTGPAKKDKN